MFSLICRKRWADITPSSASTASGTKGLHLALTPRVPCLFHHHRLRRFHPPNLFQQPAKAWPEWFKGSNTDERMTNLYAYRKAKGLCYKCGLAYSRGHKCSDIVQLHLVEELWQLLDIAESDSQSESPNAQLNSMLLSKAALVGQTANKTMKFLGSVQGIDVLILLDSGSSHTFLSSSMASQLSGCTPAATNLHVQVANASHLCCSSELVDMVWYLNDYQFQSTVRVLPLSSYDMIVGMDWLTTHNPMMVHWADKWLTIPYQGSTVKLCGLHSGDLQCAVMELCHMVHLPDKEQTLISHLPEPLQHLLDKFAHVFAHPQGLPPARDCDHHIPLIPGAQPVQMRPYRYAPALKTKIEKRLRKCCNLG